MNGFTMALERGYKKTAQLHADADAACGREWVCHCGACQIARKIKFIPLRSTAKKEILPMARYSACGKYCGEKGWKQ